MKIFKMYHFLLFFYFFSFNYNFGMNNQVDRSDELFNKFNEYYLQNNSELNKKNNPQSSLNIDNYQKIPGKQIHSAIQQRHGKGYNFTEEEITKIKKEKFQQNINYGISSVFGKYFKNPIFKSEKPELNESIKKLTKRDQEYIIDKFTNILTLMDKRNELYAVKEIDILEYLKNLNKNLVIKFKLKDFKKDFLDKINQKIQWLEKNNFIELKTEKYKNDRDELEENEIYFISKNLNNVSSKQYQNIDKFIDRLKTTLKIYNNYLQDFRKLKNKINERVDGY